MCMLQAFSTSLNNNLSIFKHRYENVKGPGFSLADEMLLDIRIQILALPCK